MKIAILIFTLFLSGCSTFLSKQDYPESQMGHVYSGTSMSIGSMCYLPNIYKNTDDGAQLTGRIILTPLIVAFYIIDLGVSLVADTVMLPFDMTSNPENSRITIAQDCNTERTWSENYEGNIY